MHRYSRRTGSLGLSRISLTLIAIIVILGVAFATFEVLSASMPTVRNPIQHIVVIMQENRTFDDYFYTYPGVIGGIGQNSSLCMPIDPYNSSSSGCIKPWLSTNPVTPDIPHTAQASQTAFDNGAMNGFIENALTANDNASEPMGYYDNSTIPNIWAYAEHYVLADMFFSSDMSYSQPNHWYMIAGNSPVVSQFEGAAQEQAQCVSGQTITWGTCYYINEAQPIKTIVDDAEQGGITWKYYDYALPPKNLDTAILDGTAFDYWNVLTSKNSTYTPSYYPNFVNRNQFFVDVANDELPQVSFVIPSAPISDHPPANITLGEYWITAVVDAIMKSSYWDNTAIIINWDDFGGFFDTIPPPVFDGFQFGFRIPAMIISAYPTMPGYIDNTVYSFESTLKFIEYTFHLPPLDSRDSDANNLLNAFNFNQHPRAPYIINLTASEVAALSLYQNISSTATPNPGAISTTAKLNPDLNASNNFGLAFIDNDED